MSAVHLRYRSTPSQYPLRKGLSTRKNSSCASGDDECSTYILQHYLPPLVEKEDPEDTNARNLYEGARRQLRDRPTHPRFKYADWQARNRPASMPDMDQEDLALQKRRYVYRHGLYVKHVASNRYTRVSRN